MTLTDNERKFIYAAEKGKLDTIKSLILRNKISLERHKKIKDGDGWTVLHLASRDGCLEVVRFFLEENSVDVNGKNNHGDTALHYASYNGHVETMKLLIANGANVNQQTNDGRTPLHFASVNDQLSAVNLLLEAGAVPTIQDNDNSTALVYARQDDVANSIFQHIQQKQQIQKLLRCNDRLPIAVWPNAISHLNSVNFIHQLLSEIPFLLKHAAEEAEKGSHSTKR